MSDINTTILALFEDKGFFGVEMYNDKYPASQDNGGTQSHAKNDGASALDYGNSSNFAKEENINYLPNTNGRPNLKLGNGPDYADYEDYIKPGAARPIVRFH